jgi:CRP-like cAMP-binding protein
VIVSMWKGGAGGRALLVVLAVSVAGPALAALVKLVRSRVEFVRATYRRIVFRFQQKWRIEAVALLDASGAFGDLPVDVLSDLAGRVRLRSVRPGQALIRQGEPASAYFLVRRGTLRVLEEDAARASEREIGMLLRGDGFGEVGLLTDRPRQATVRAVTRAELFELDAATFRRVLSGRAELASYAATLAGADELRELGCFRRLSRTQARSLLEHGEWVQVSPGTDVVSEGGEPDAFYAIAAGRAEVLKEGRPVGELGRGGWFGELALIDSTTRAATVRARTPMRVFRVTRDGFSRYVADAFRDGTLRSSAELASSGAGARALR